MNRRQLLCAPALALAVIAPKLFAAEGHTIAYSRQIYDQALASGKPFMLDFFAHW